MPFAACPRNTSRKNSTGSSAALNMLSGTEVASPAFAAASAVMSTHRSGVSRAILSVLPSTIITV